MKKAIIGMIMTIMIELGIAREADIEVKNIQLEKDKRYQMIQNGY